MTDTRTRLLTDLRRIEDDDYRLRPGEQEADLVPALLAHLGDPAPELRDELVYPTFRAFITDGRLTEQELRTLLDTLIDDRHLFHGIGGLGDPSVFTRTFSMLVVALVLERHRRRPFLAADQFARVRDALLRYHGQEQDLRGLVDEGGWAHAAAHGADALDELVRCPEADPATCRAVLDALRGLLHNGATIFADEEDERIATVVDALIEQSLLPAQEIAEWLGGLADRADQPSSRAQMVARTNTKNLLRSLHFRRPRTGPLAAAILAAEARVNSFRAD
ncbi:DUF2785 domain-containing protein [Micromonospora sp. DR5-3]|uniref:DUF2785 domain-containing protein n=1 Tax=unclassified Micromonospora TaxID=2617518 RepID=UPI002106E7BF|nr:MULTISPECIES: DUF2785 domain-containing protein [unclassified Micromonospora]MCW3818218.1 DUF2785 domain-containing protein [Micromonospora sp. DR5-3]